MNRPDRTSSSDQARSEDRRAPRLLLALLLIAAMGGGLAAGQAAEAYQQSQQRSSPAVTRGESLTGRVTHVVDGDTFDVILTTREAMRVRLEGIDCPERGQPFSQAARNFTRESVLDQVVTLRVVDVDRFGRLVARAIVDGKDVSVELLKAGLAWHFTTYSSDKRLAAAEQQARAARRGLWAHPDPTPPWVARRPRTNVITEPPRPPAETGGLYGNVRSRVYHRSTCANAKCTNCVREFANAADAEAAGFRPAGDCHDTRRP
jgi:micrococcal nuclease